MTGSKESPGYAIMEAEALAKKPEDREPWEVRYLESLEEMRQAERDARHPIAVVIVRIIIVYIFVVIGLALYELTTRLWSIYGNSIMQMFI